MSDHLEEGLTPEELNNSVPLFQDDRKRMKQLTRRGIIWGLVALIFADKGWQWLSTRRQINGVPWPMAIALRINEQIARDFFSQQALAKEYPPSMAQDVIDNGDIGRPKEYDFSTWKGTLSDDNWDDDHSFSMAEILALPKVNMTTELRCIEGWVRIISWGGCRLSDFVAAHPPAERNGMKLSVTNPNTLPEYVGIATDSGDYYVGLDAAAAMHPQTLLCYEMNGKRLEPDHGAPLRLVIPTKYGIKNIKWIGKITYTDNRPVDYWAEQGYDWYAGL